MARGDDDDRRPDATATPGIGTPRCKDELERASDAAIKALTQADIDDMDVGALKYLKSRQALLSSTTREYLMDTIFDRAEASDRRAEAEARRAEASDRRAEASDRRLGAMLTEVWKGLGEPLFRGTNFLLNQSLESVGSSKTAWGVPWIALEIWDTFCTDIGLADNGSPTQFSAMMQQSIERLYFPTPTSPLALLVSEAEVRSIVGWGTNYVMIRLAQALGMTEFIETPEAATTTGSRADILWKDNQQLPLVVGELKRPLAVVTRFKPSRRMLSRRGMAAVLAQQIADRKSRADLASWASSRGYQRNALEQLLGYMVCFGLRYGYLSTGEFTWFVEHDGDGTIKVSRPFEGGMTGDNFADSQGRADDSRLSVNQAMFAFLRHARSDRSHATGLYPSARGTFLGKVKEAWGAKRSDGFARLARDMRQQMLRLNVLGPPNPPGRRAALLQSLRSVLPITSEDEFMIPLPWSDNYSIVAESETAVTARCSSPDMLPEYFVKTLTLSNNEEKDQVAHEEFENEIRMYTGPLRSLQGIACPFLVYGGKFKRRFIISTTTCGRSLHWEDVENDSALRDRVRAALQAIHDAGVLHGDVALRNFALDEASGRVSMIDFGRSSVASEHSGARAKMRAEMDQLDAAFEGEEF